MNDLLSKNILVIRSQESLYVKQKLEKRDIHTILLSTEVSEEYKLILKF